MLIASAAEITRQLQDTENYLTCFDQSRTTIDFKYIIIIIIYLKYSWFLIGQQPTVMILSQ
jgi:hypothetical protein